LMRPSYTLGKPFIYSLPSERFGTERFHKH
jgi:hypothetical protein